MAATLDLLRTLSATERMGSIFSLRRLALVTGLSQTDYTVLFKALEDAGLPAAYSTLTDYPNLVLAERNPTLIDKDKVEVDLLYEHISNVIPIIEDTDGSMPFVFPAKYSISLTQEKSLYSIGNDGKNNQRLELTYTYPSDDPTYPNDTVSLGAEVDIYKPQTSFILKGIIATDAPTGLQQKIISKLNSEMWNNRPARCWLCTKADFELFDFATTPTKYLFDFEFQLNQDTWDQKVYFVDPRTGQVPGNLVDDASYKTVQIAGTVDFADLLNGIGKKED